MCKSKYRECGENGNGQKRKNVFYVDLTSASDDIVSGSQTCINLRVNGTSERYLVDAGVSYEDDEQILITNPEKIDSIFLTHVHADHSALLPYVVKNGFGNNNFVDIKNITPRIYMSEATRQLLGISLADSLSVLKSKYRNNKSEDLYNIYDLRKTLNLSSTLAYNETVEISDHVKVTIFANSHIPGSSSILLEIHMPEYLQDSHFERSPINLLFTGDLKTKGNDFLKDMSLPEWVKEIPINIITESTYARESYNNREKVFAKNIVKAINENKTVVIPVLALGRGQQILYEITKLQKQKKLSKNVPIYLDGKLFHKYNYKFKKLKEVRLKPEEYTPENMKEIEKPEQRKKIKEYNGPQIIITTSGNGSFGPASEYIQKAVKSPNNLIHFTSFQPKETLGRKLCEAKIQDMVRVNGSEEKLYCEVKYTEEFSSHAEFDELIEFLKQFKNIKSIGVTHGEAEERQNMIQRILKEKLVSENNVFNLTKRKLIRIDSWGVCKIMNSKL